MSVDTSVTSARPRKAGATARAGMSFASPLPRLLLGFAGILAMLTLWELVSRTELLPSRYFPPASLVLATLAAELGRPQLWLATGLTMRSWAIGLFVASVAGVVLGFLIGLSPFLRRFTHSTIEFLRPIPSVALIPLAVLLFGARMQSTIMLIVYACFWQVLIQVLYGTADVDSVVDNTARSFRFSRWARIRHVVWPTTLPYLMTGLRLAATVALVLAITSELVIGAPGLGREIAMAQSGGAVSRVYALAMLTGLLGVAVNLVMRALEARLLAWHVSVRTDKAA